MDVGARDDAGPEAGGDAGQAVGQGAVVGMVVAGQLDPEVVAEEVPQPGRRPPGRLVVARQERGGECAAAAARQADEPGGVRGQWA
ncbi:MAG: hypothetical protein AVDCRST_MAG88-3610 [uncultured Thermomicrobiales bacterium]|uniref:Uncharacterized protein n=1 Tax=uncultured Thermomicrobiales bacterium TaxID=1645740 RepID=A0A6J4VMI1_9BACT|nr:MAG: hypothetical protein AVDCRST_MAG88-3610 [uncultured Thermomicrobiales bacterium]